MSAGPLTPLKSEALRAAAGGISGIAGALAAERSAVLPNDAVQIRQIRTPEIFDAAAERTLGEVADLVRRSREAIWGTGQLSNEAEGIFTDLHDPWERVVLLGAFLEDRLVGRAEIRLPLVVHTRSAVVLVTVDPQCEARGVGLELLAAAEQLSGAEARRRITIQSEHPGPVDLQGDGRIGSPTGAMAQVRPEACRPGCAKSILRKASSLPSEAFEEGVRATCRARYGRPNAHAFQAGRLLAAGV